MKNQDTGTKRIGSDWFVAAVLLVATLALAAICRVGDTDRSSSAARIVFPVPEDADEPEGMRRRPPSERGTWLTVDQ